jgi:hypothetical protein
LRFFNAFFLPDVDGDDDNEWLHRGQLTQNNEKIGMSYLLFDITRVHMCKGSYVDFNTGFIRIAGGDVMINSENNGEAINDSCIDTTIDSGIGTTVDGGKCAVNIVTSYFLNTNVRYYFFVNYLDH